MTRLDDGVWGKPLGYLTVEDYMGPLCRAELSALPPVPINVSRDQTALEIVETSTCGRVCAIGGSGGSLEEFAEYVHRQIKSVAAARAVEMDAAGACTTHGGSSQQGVHYAIGGGGRLSEPMSVGQLTMDSRVVDEAVAHLLQVYAFSFSDSFSDVAFENRKRMEAARAGPGARCVSSGLDARDRASGRDYCGARARDGHPFTVL